MVYIYIHRRIMKNSTNRLGRLFYPIPSMFDIFYLYLKTVFVVSINVGNIFTIRHECCGNQGFDSTPTTNRRWAPLNLKVHGVATIQVIRHCTWGASASPTEVQVENRLAIWVGFLKAWVSPTTMGFSLLKIIILWCEMGVPPFEETPIWW